MSSTNAVNALRNSVAISRLDHVHYITIRGESAYDALDHVCGRDLHVRDGQLLHTLLLDEDGHLFADVYVGCDDEDFFLLAEGPTSDEVADFLRDRASAFELEIESPGRKHMAIDGPYAWELLGTAVGYEAIGLPYLTFFHLDQGLCYRAGKTGEYGYGIIAAPDIVDKVWQRCEELERQFELAVAELEDLDQCALENWFLNIRREGREAVTPLELQLQWRVSTRKEYVGSAALAERRHAGVRQRLTALVSEEPLNVGDDVSLDGSPVGRIVNAGFSVTRNDWVALGLVDVEYAYPGLDVFRVADGDRRVTVRSASPPLINNRSLYVNPQIHSFGTRHEFEFPALTAP